MPWPSSLRHHFLAVWGRSHFCLLRLLDHHGRLKVNMTLIIKPWETSAMHFYRWLCREGCLGSESLPALGRCLARSLDGGAPTRIDPSKWAPMAGVVALDGGRKAACWASMFAVLPGLRTLCSLAPIGRTVMVTLPGCAPCAPFCAPFWFNTAGGGVFGLDVPLALVVPCT